MIFCRCLATVLNTKFRLARKPVDLYKVEQTLVAGWASDPVHPASHVYAKMALNLIEKVAIPSAKPDSRKRKRSDDSGSGSGGGAGYQHSSGQVNPRSGHSGGQPRAGTGNQRTGMQQAGGYGSGSGFGYAGSGQASTRNYSPSHNSNQSRGRAGQAGVRPDPATTTTSTIRGTAAAAAAARGAAVEAPATEASPVGSIGRDGKNPSPISNRISALKTQLYMFCYCLTDFFLDFSI